MPSPFPGMDPYLEGRLWADVHTTLLTKIRGALMASIPAAYLAELQEYVWLVAAEPDVRRRGPAPDVFLADGAGSGQPHPPAAVAVAEPTVRVTLPTAAEVQKKKHILVVDAEDNRVVTVIELLSPSDKLPKDDRARYLAKRAEYLGARVNLVEIDLLRKGQRPPMGEPDPPEADYYVLVTRADEYPAAAVWAFTVRDPMPVIPIPLKPEDAAVPLDLRACLDRAYDEARYDRRIDYTQPATPALRKPDAEWAADLLKTHVKP